MLIQPYLFFDGRCEEAITFYRKALGAEVEILMHYKESPGPMPPGTHADFGNKVMHANLRIGDGSVMMADDCMGHPNFEGFTLSLSVADEAEAKAKFAALGQGGEVKMALGKTFFSPCFGMVTDRFGVSWMVIVAMPEA
jgi:PhnB protein